MVALLAFLIPAGLAWGLNFLAMAGWRKAVGRHWSERAALLYPARASSLLNLLLIPASFTAVAFICQPHSSLLRLAITSLAGALIGTYPMDREIMEGIGFGRWCHQVTARLFLNACLWAPFWIVAYRMPDDFGPRARWTAAALTVYCLVFQFGLGLRLMRWLRLLRPASSALNSLVADVSRAQAVPVRATWILRRPSADACAFVVTRELGFSERLLANLNDDEFRSIAAHELAHFTEGRWVTAVRVARALWFVPLIFLRPTVHTFGPLGAALLGVSLFVFRVAIGRMERAKEVRADRAAVGVVLDPAIYARALERLHQLNLIPAVMPKKSKLPHPNLYDRMIAAGVTPDFPRPFPARAQCWTSNLMFAIAALAVTSAAILTGNG